MSEASSVRGKWRWRMFKRLKSPFPPVSELAPLKNDTPRHDFGVHQNTTPPNHDLWPPPSAGEGARIAAAIRRQNAEMLAKWQGHLASKQRKPGYRTTDDEFLFDLGLNGLPDGWPTEWTPPEEEKCLKAKRSLTLAGCTECGADSGGYAGPCFTCQPSSTVPCPKCGKPWSKRGIEANGQCAICFDLGHPIGKDACPVMD